MGRDTGIGLGSVVEAGAVIGDGCVIGHHVVIHDLSRIGNGVRIDDHAVIGKLPLSASRSKTTAAGRELPPAVIGDDSLIGTAAIVYAGAVIGAGVLIADTASVREDTVIGAAIRQFNRRRGSGHAFGPLAGDAALAKWAEGAIRPDAVLAMYHDQGLIPFKLTSFGRGVNFTAGLPVVRTSPAHGTAYDIAGEDKASPESFLQAVYLGIDIFKNRQLYKELSKNPLKKYEINPNQVDESVDIESGDTETI